MKLRRALQENTKKEKNETMLNARPKIVGRPKQTDDKAATSSARKSQKKKEREATQKVESCAA
jgi:hypothetical protein